MSPQILVMYWWRRWKVSHRYSCLTQHDLDEAYEGHEFELDVKFGAAGYGADAHAHAGTRASWQGGEGQGVPTGAPGGVGLALLEGGALRGGKEVGGGEGGPDPRPHVVSGCVRRPAGQHLYVVFVVMTYSSAMPVSAAHSQRRSVARLPKRHVDRRLWEVRKHAAIE